MKLKTDKETPMATIEIKHLYTGAVLYTHQGESTRDAVEAAVRARANLEGADLAYADLEGADLACADLEGADLADADLAYADLARANLARADLADANLAYANLAYANLARANLEGADLEGARNAPPLAATDDTPRTYERKRRTSAERAAEYRARHPEVPVVKQLDQRILDAIARPGCKLDMSDWHSCETTHCRAGWAIHLAGEAGYALERALGSPLDAGRAIYRASTGRVPHFFASDESALADLRRCAERDARGDEPEVRG